MKPYTIGLVNYWPFAGSLRDVISGDDLMPQLNVALSSDQFKTAFSALHLNTGFATAPVGVYFDCTTHGFTLMFWIKVIAYGTGNPRILSFYNSGYADRVYIYYPFNILSINDISLNTPLNLGIWTHIAVTANSSINTIFIDGHEAASGSFSCGAGVTRKFCNIGRSETFPGDSDLNAYLDELKIFKRPLSQLEVAAEILLSQPYEIFTGTLINVFAPPVAYTLGLTNYWPFSGNTVDVVGGMNLTIQSNGQYELDRFDNSNASLYLNQGWATAPPGVYFDCAIGYTIMAWVKLLALNNYQRILEFSNGDNKNDVLFFFDVMKSTLVSATTNQNSGWSHFASSTTDIKLGVWTHVATTVNYMDNNVYINGRLVGTATGGICTAVERFSCKIGRDDANGSYLNAVLDELKIFNRVLTSTEISNEMTLLEPYKKIISKSN